ncbi:MAG: hypothetical protein EOO40_00825 [Deltaproteobacteria bacterium]|nr:MAG: hypothetical protein EOO40_00825 [Deltaproteobacteria bacterium]
MNVQRQPSHRSERPSAIRRASQRDAQGEGSVNPQVFRDRYEQYPFADPPIVRAFSFGPPVYTTEHKRLVQRLRDENARQAQDLAEARRDVASAKHVEGVRWTEQVVVQNEMRRVQQTNVSLMEQLKEAMASLDELDQVHRAQQSKRMSRIALPDSDADVEVRRAFLVPRETLATALAKP